MLHLEPYLDAAREYLRDNLPTRLAVVNGELTDFELPVPDQDSYLLGVTSTTLKYPLIEVASPDWTMTAFDLGQFTGDFNFTIVVRAMLQDLDYDRLTRSLYRYGRCLTEVLCEPGAFGEGVVDSIRGAYRVNPETNDREEFVAGALLVFSIRSTETRP